MNIKELTNELKNNLTDDILDRYNCSEYWDPKLIEDFIDEHQLDTNQRETLLEELYDPLFKNLES